MLIGACLGLLSLFGIARLLTPSESGMGTHQRLGLPPCGAIVMFGIPCPSCGMTTSWAWFARGEFYRSMATNPGGFLLALFVIVMATWMGISGIANRWWPIHCDPFVVLAGGMIVMLVTLIQWVWRLL